MKFKFSIGDKVRTDYNGRSEVLTVSDQIIQPEEYADEMPNLYLMSNDQILKEDHLEAI